MKKVYKKGVTIFIEADATLRIPSAYTAYSIINDHVKIINLIDDSTVKIHVDYLANEHGDQVQDPDNYLCEIIGSHN